ncbi:HlyD family secretion protein [Allosphingosinicella humi]
MKEGVISAADAEAIRAEGEATPPKKRWLRLVVMLSVPLILAIAGGYYWVISGRYVSTDNAYVQQDKVSISAEVSGPIAEVFVRENQVVKKGDLLFRIDPRPYRIALAEAEAQISAAQVQVGKLEAESSATAADIMGATDNIRIAERALARQSELLARGFTTRARYDDALHAVQEAKERLANANADAVTARAALKTGGVSSQPAVAAALAARDKALLDLKRTEVHAPTDGYVSQTARLQVGNTVVAGVPMVTVVRSGDAWIEANYKETDLADMRVGQPAKVHFDAYPSLRVTGRVESIGAGTGSEFSVLPAQNATGNWVKVTQRVPVRIAIEGRPDRAMIAGLSAEVTVDTKSGGGQGQLTLRR